MRKHIAAGRIGAALAIGIVFGGGAAADPREVLLEGVVRDEAGTPLRDVRIKTFVDGFRQATALTGADGSYSVAISFDPGSDPTVVAWWLPPEAGRVPELAIVRESARARALSIWSPCVPRLEPAARAAFDVVLCREAEKLRRLRESGCLEAESRER